MANVPINNITDTWNSSGTTFTGIKFNVTDTASAAGSLLMDLQVGGSSKFKVDKGGYITASGLGLDAYNRITYVAGAGLAVNQSGYFAALIGYQKAMFWTSAAVGWTSDGGNLDLALARDAANILAQRNGVNAQTSRLYGTYTDASNYRRLAKTMSSAGVAEIKPEGAGTGATGNVLYISGLPTSNPGPGILWNNGGVVNVGT